MANVNLATGKIYGCKEDTLKYYHEVGHLKFEDEAHNGNAIRQLQYISLLFLIYATGFYVLLPNEYLKWLLISLMLTNIFMEMYEEYWCWLYARQKKDENKRHIKDS